MSNHLKGLLLTSLGVLIISPDGLLTRLISASSLEITYWRGIYFGYGMLVYMAFRHGRKFLSEVFDIGYPGLLLVLLFAVGNISFIYSITHTSVANTLLILSTTPLFAAILSWIFLKESVDRNTWIAIVLVAVGIVVICMGKGQVSGSLTGNIVGLAAACALAAGFCVIRARKNVRFLPSLGLGGFFAALLISPWIEPTSVTSTDHVYLFIMGFIMLPVANAFMFLGPKYLPAAEVGLVMLLESICGPLWVWLALGENPGVYTLVGGTLIVLTLAVHAVVRMRSTS